MSEQSSPDPQPGFSLIGEMRRRLSSLFHLWDETDRPGTIATITENIEFKGNSVWSLIIAIFIASIGLNTNSPAVIIGAMLISPLMGPIMGAGMALGSYDTQLLKRSLANLGIMTGISIATSFVYFLLSPLHQVTPELLARTVPTFFDVLIAFFGGTAMIISISRKSRSTNAIAGVAIATALMPPLCTAGFGLATQNLAIFAGAFYLYLINSVFIGLTTLVFTKYLKLRQASNQQGKVLTTKRVAIFAAIAVAFLAPSIYMGYDLIQETGFQSRADRFISLNMNFTDSQVSNVVKKRGTPHSTLHVTILGTPLSKEMIAHLQAQLPEFGLDGTELKIIQNGKETPGPESLTPNIPPLNPGQTPAPALASSPTPAPAFDRNLQLGDVARELAVLFPELETFSWGDLLVTSDTQISPVKTYTVLTKWKPGLETPDLRAKLQLFLKVRLHSENLAVLTLK